MTTTAAVGRDVSKPRTSRWLRIALVVMAIGQPVSTVIFNLLSPTQLTSGQSESPIVPPGPMFAIWGVILISSIAWSVASARPSVRGDPVRDRLSIPLIVVFAGFALWLAAASTGQSSPLTLPAFLVILGGLAVAGRRALRDREAIDGWHWWDRGLLRFTLGVYGGWTSIAFFVNIATVVQASGAPIDGVWGTTWQSLVLLAAAGTAVAVAWLSTGSIAYATTATYAFIGAGISSAGYGYALLAWLCGAAIVLTWFTTLIARRRMSQATSTTEGRPFA